MMFQPFFSEPLTAMPAADQCSEVRGLSMSDPPGVGLGTYSSLPSFASVQGLFGLKLSFFQLLVIGGQRSFVIHSLIDHENHRAGDDHADRLPAGKEDCPRKSRKSTEKKETELMTKVVSDQSAGTPPTCPPLSVSVLFRPFRGQNPRFALTSGPSL